MTVDRQEVELERSTQSNAFWSSEPTAIDDIPGKHGDELRLWLRLLTCSTLIEKEVRRRLRHELEFTLPRFDLLAQLDKAQHGLILGELSRRMMVSAGNLTALVERLVESGHVTRTPLSTDRRAYVIALTPLGRESFRKMADRHGGWISSLFAGISAEESAVLIEHLGILKRSVQKKLETDGE